MRFSRPLAALLVLLLGSVAVAASVAGWSEGTPAANSANVLQGLGEPVEIPLPASLAERIDGPTLLVYFSPTCPHCQHAQPELNEVAERLAGKAKVLGIASSRSDPKALDRYRDTYKVRYPLIIDEDAAIARAISARSTPSVIYLEPEKRKIVAKDAWYPFRRGQGSLLVMRALGTPFAGFDEGRYHGNATCMACHTEEAGAWLLSHHSVAWDTLLARDDHQKAECVGCHVTGMGKPTGWVAGDTARDHLVDVGCEACHGPGGPHDGKVDAPAEACAGCHDKKHSIAFSVAKGLPLIDHYAANKLDDDAFTAELRALHSGERERPLLAFAEGPHVGSAACKSCHTDEHAWWSQDPHGKAMATLSTKEHEGAPAAEAVACVRCHASPKTHGGPEPTELAGFALDEGGVGCESCHGPGGAHVKAGGGTDNIEGLGDDCPVCVLEALCTSCHTTTWDPTWDLDRRLKAVGHK